MNNLSVTFDGTSPEHERTVTFNAEDVFSQRNEYNMQVIGADDNSVTGVVPGMVSVDVFSPKCDRAETTRQTADLSTGCRKFQLFEMSVERAVFSVTGLGAGLRVVVTCFRGDRGPR